MAAGKENTGLQVALIIFVILTIVLSVTTFMFYKNTEEALVAKAASEDKVKVKNSELVKVQKNVNTLKHLVGKLADPADPVEGIMKEFENDQILFAATYPGGAQEEPAANTYPYIMRYQSDANKKLQEIIAQRDTQIVDLEASHATEIARLKADNEKTQVAFKGQDEEIRAQSVEFAKGRAGFEGQLSKFNNQVGDARRAVLAADAAAKKDKDELTQQLQAKSEQLDLTKDELEGSRVVDLEAPDGEVVWINQANGTVYLNLGYSDGLRRQTTFSVFDRDVTNALNATKKGAIEVVRVDKANLSVARITSDDPKNPIVKGDKVVSGAFHPGRPERFAFAGKIDIDGDDRGDLELMKSLVTRNGAIVDAYVDDEGNRNGTMSPATKYLIMGDTPTEKSDPKVLSSYRRMLDEATKYGVKTMSVADFLDYMGYQGRERSVGLGRRANPDDFVPGAKKGGTSPFRRRSASGAY